MRKKKDELSVRAFAVQESRINMHRLASSFFGLDVGPLSKLRTKAKHLAHRTAVGIPAILVAPVPDPQVVIKRLALGANKVSGLLSVCVPSLSGIVR